MAGDAVWNCQALVRIVFGPLTAEQFRSFLPDGECFSEAAALTRLFLGSTLELNCNPLCAAMKFRAASRWHRFGRAAVGLVGMAEH